MASCTARMATLESTLSAPRSSPSPRLSPSLSPSRLCASPRSPRCTLQINHHLPPATATANRRSSPRPRRRRRRRPTTRTRIPQSVPRALLPRAAADSPTPCSPKRPAVSASALSALCALLQCPHPDLPRLSARALTLCSLATTSCAMRVLLVRRRAGSLSPWSVPVPPLRVPRPPPSPPSSAPRPSFANTTTPLNRAPASSTPCSSSSPGARRMPPSAPSARPSSSSTWSSLPPSRPSPLPATRCTRASLAPCSGTRRTRSSSVAYVRPCPLFGLCASL